MKRTSRRPLPTGRVAASQAAWMGWVLVIAGFANARLAGHLPTMACGLATWFLYVAVYTPLKLRHWSNTLAARCPVRCPYGWFDRGRWFAGGPSALGYCWVFLLPVNCPTLCRSHGCIANKYESAGYKMITVTDKSGPRCCPGTPYLVRWCCCR